MKYNPDRHHRRSIRLPEYDYSQSGIYFVTVCTYQKQCLFGDIIDGQMFLNQIGKLVREEWLKSAQIRQEIELDEWVIMPNHLHGIVVIGNRTNLIEGADLIERTNLIEGADLIERTNLIEGADLIERTNLIEGARLAPLQMGRFLRKPRSLSSFVGGFKSAVTRRMKGFCNQSSSVVWQRNYYESIVRDEQKLNLVREYIRNNPEKWAKDPEKPENSSEELLIDLIF